MSTSLIDELRHSEISVRECALQQAMHFRPFDDSLYEAIVVLLEDREEEIRALAAETLAGSNFYSYHHQSRILLALRDQSPRVRAFLLQSLTIFPADEAILAAGLALLHDSALLVRIQAACLVWHCSAGVDIIADVMTEGLRSEDNACLIASCRLVALQGIIVESYLHDLIKLTRHAYGNVRANALFAIRKCCSEASLLESLQLQMAHDIDPSVRYILDKISRKKDG